MRALIFVGGIAAHEKKAAPPTEWTAPPDLQKRVANYIAPITPASWVSDTTKWIHIPETACPGT